VVPDIPSKKGDREKDRRDQVMKREGEASEDRGG
jgi:hypothetical protein